MSRLQNGAGGSLLTNKYFEKQNSVQVLISQFRECHLGRRRQEAKMVMGTQRKYTDFAEERTSENYRTLGLDGKGSSISCAP